jgi:hypothetical protein
MQQYRYRERTSYVFSEHVTTRTKQCVVLSQQHFLYCGYGLCRNLLVVGLSYSAKMPAATVSSIERNFLLPISVLTSALNSATTLTRFPKIKPILTAHARNWPQ